MSSNEYYSIENPLTSSKTKNDKSITIKVKKLTSLEKEEEEENHQLC